MRSERLANIPSELLVLAETRIEAICDVIDSHPNVKTVVIDSIQTMHREDVESAPGSVAQVRECTAMLMQKAKRSGVSIFLVGHVTKEGSIAGPKVLEHMVDTVLHFEGESVYAYRVLRAIKNRYGSTNEIGVFEMTQDGLQEISNPSEVFLSERNTEESGTAVVAAIEGSRPLLIEVQALVTPTSYGTPQRSATGFEYRRLQMILAVLEKRLGVRLGQQDVFINIAGGIRLDDPAVDLGIAAAVVSSYRDIPVEPTIAFIGEIGLTGEVRTATSMEVRLNEVQKLGFQSAMIPKSSMKRLNNTYSVQLLPVDKILSALMKLFS
jgi:DNA repair protein RadA/Sms